MPAVSAIYAIRNELNGDLYIGSAQNVRSRWKAHQRLLLRNKHHSAHLQRAYTKYGSGNLLYCIVEYVDDKDNLLEREQTWLDFFKPKYNISRFAGSPMKGLKLSAETRARMSAAKMGKKRPPMTDEHRERISASKKGKKLSGEGLRSLRESFAMRFTPEYRRSWSEERKGKSTITEEGRKKISASKIGNSYTKGMKFPKEAYDSRRGPRGRS